MTNVAGAERFSLARPSPWLRGYLVRNFPLRKLLPDREPAYVSSVLYTMGVLTLAALIVAVISGAIIALGGVSFWHTNSFGAFMNSIHFWSVQAMFLFMAVHFITNFFTLGWRGGRGWTWINGVKLSLRRCRIVCVARRGQEVVAGDRLPDLIGIGVLTSVFIPELVDRVVDEAGVRERRKRTLPARVVVYYLLAMVLFFQSGYGEVWNKLVAGLDWARRFRVRLEAGMQPSPAAITYARQRLGWQVMERLMEAVAGPLAGQDQQAAFVSGMRLAAIDGMCLDLPDTPENGAEFGYPGNGAGRGPFPQIRVVGLGECGTRAVLGAATSPLAVGEQPLARRLLPRLRRGDLLLADRNFLSHGLLEDVLAAGVHVLWRAKSDVDLPVLEVLPDGTWLSRIADPAASRKLRRKGASGGDIPGITVRVIEYSVTSEDGAEVSETFTLVTDILDPALLSPEQAAAAYASRWQLETCFDELETSLRGGAAVVLRSKSPPMIRQEIYAMLCCYQAIRTLISHAAGDAGIDPARISFTRARDAIRSRISDSGCFSP